MQHQRIGYLDGWRALAIIFVLWGHFFPIDAVSMARLGVELFLVLSGRLMAEILFVRGEGIRVFLLRRIARVWPALFVFVAAMVAASILLRDSIPLVHVLGTLTFTVNYAFVYFGNVGRIDHLWSLSVEEWTYIGLAVVAVIVRGRNIPPAAILTGLIVVTVLNGLLQSAAGLGYYSVYWRTDVRSASIFMGALAFLLLRGRNVPGPVPLCAFVAGIVFSADLFPDTVKYTLGSASLAVSLATMGQAPLLVRDFLSVQPLRYMAMISFSLYLWQQPFFVLIPRLHPVLLLAGAMVAALASFYLVEDPARRYLNGHFARRTSPA